ncbi:lipid A biosynthesis lauroyl acyltransferase [Actinomycetospora sp. NBRC 106375]|uniref:phosphatidylinositol mannoside acyltransferase n=1 Tax=Actinomycetospora sp. NBRC 106375 TaxID=3032207 RepID=UPI0024A544FA|nr:phosphatidylinositol mannoside acyltransferase [Actinomycetospora sp. NBRC 106375]GLZ44500.1 lipid A biosynthesis lauroyl acyltransferase [Actinomycetospora sp. NBRC 106375]
MTTTAPSGESAGESLGERASELGYAAGWRLVRAVPEPAARWAFARGADLAARRGGKGVRRLRANLARVRTDADDAELDALTAAGLRSYARYWREAFRLPAMDHDALVRRPHVEGQEHLDAALATGRGAIVALTHSGNWDMAGLWLVAHSGRFTTVAERLRPESLYERFVAYRESLGMEILPMTGGDSPVRGLVRALREGRVVCLVADRDLSAHGVPVTFFGAPSSMPPGPASLAAATGAALLPVGLWFTEDPDTGEEGWGFRIHPPVDVPDRAAVPAATQRVADVFAADIAEHPADWHMLQRVWHDQD